MKKKDPSFDIIFIEESDFKLYDINMSGMKKILKKDVI